MSKTHHYSIRTVWEDKSGTGTTGYKDYSRNHVVSSPGKYDYINMSSDPAFRGDASRYNPEELLLASISSCHMLWYLHLCTTKQIVVLCYKDDAKGLMSEGPNGAGRFTKVVLHPTVVISPESDVEMAAALHHNANAMCFIANSCNFPIVHVPVIEVATT